MSDSEDDDGKQAWNIGCSVVIPEKSRYRYETTYKIFKKWCEEKEKNINEEVLLEYFVGRNNELKAPGGLWAEYSMLKTTIFLHDSIDIAKFSSLIAFLKRKNVGYKPKKANVFSKEEMYTFLNKASDDKFLIQKVAMILGVAGACRREELYNMTINDIEDHSTIIIIKIPNTKTNIQRTFTVTNKNIANEENNYLDICRKYIKLRPNNARSLNLFLKYQKGKCCDQVVGKGTIGRWPSQIAEYLNLPNPAGYTGHSFRRTSTTFLANIGVDIIGLKRHSDWKSPTVAEGYVEDSHPNEIQFARKNLQGMEEDYLNSDDTELNDNESEKYNEDNELLVPSTSLHPFSQENDSYSLLVRQKRKNQNETIDADETCNKFLKNMNEQPDTNECILYTQLLAKKLKALDENTRERAMFEINNVMYQLKQSPSSHSVKYPHSQDEHSLLTPDTMIETFSPDISVKIENESQPSPSNHSETNKTLTQTVKSTGEVQDNTNKSANTDEWECFGQFVGQEIKNFKNNSNKKKVKRDILRVIMKYQEMEDSED